MANLTIGNLDEATKQALRVRAAQHGVSMEEEARRILRSALDSTPQRVMLGSHLRDRFRKVAVDAFVLPKRQAPRNPPRWDE